MRCPANLLHAPEHLLARGRVDHPFCREVKGPNGKPT
jgi:hypothetical protein